MTTREIVLTLLGAALVSGAVSFFVGRAAARGEVAESRRPAPAPVASTPTIAEGTATRTLPPTPPGDVVELKRWDDDEEVRHTWMFVPEATLLARFGVPRKALALDNGQEMWEYVVGSDEISLMLTRGRLTAVYWRAVPQSGHDE